MFLPGASGDRETWKALALRLTHQGERTFVGYPGFGGEPHDASIDGLESLTDRVAAQLEGPTHVFAQSMGGAIAMRLALRAAKCVQSVVLAVTSGGIDLSGAGAIDWRAQFRNANPTVPDWFERERVDLSRELTNVRCRVLLLWGDADPISPIAVGERLHALLPDAELVVVPGADHDLVRTHVDAILPHVERHLALSAQSERPSP
jgi:pimeloyl-ACP methyl ester carboxylesterase